MLIIPVIYILDGGCVALYKGSFEQKEEYFKHPADMARTFERDGASILYVVDLNAKISGGVIQEKLIEQIIHSVKIPVWFEADFKNIDSMREALNQGVQRLVLVSPPLEFLEQALAIFGSAQLIVQVLGKRAILVEPFTTQLVNVKKGDMIYFSSDGFSDQFGGPEGKKFKTSQFKKLLLEIYDKPVATQKELLANTHTKWKGAHEQVDDVCVIGVQIV